MSLTKKLKDQLVRSLLGKASIPRGLFEIDQYFRRYKTINFRFEEGQDGNTVAISTDYILGSIVTSGKTANDLDKNIKDAILTSFEIPSSFAKEVAINRVGDKQREYALT